MALDLSRVAGQAWDMISGLRQSQSRAKDSLDKACAIFNAPPDVSTLRQKVAASKTSWLLAEPVDGLSGRFDPPGSVPADHIVLASDGSQIDVDRHRVVHCFLINIGTVKLEYGTRPAAELKSIPILFSNPDELVFAPPQGFQGPQIPIEGSLLGIKRSMEEYNYLSVMTESVPDGSTALALTDGSLLMWSLAGREYPDYLVKTVLDESILASFEAIRKTSTSSARIPLASYISLPRSTDVINTLRLVICPHSMADCEKYCSAASAERPCDILAGLRDRDLFWDRLGPFQRSEVFASQSKISKLRYGANQVYFFYLKLEDEVARIEVPEWVVRDRPLLETAHDLLVDQCRKGHGYPVALSEAHEQAVVSGADRDNFYRLIDEYMAEIGLSSTVSAKSLSKRTRWI